MRFHTTRRTAKILLSALFIALLAAPGLAENPYLQPDDSWISISGTVTSATEDEFVLDYGDGLITVEMDDWDWYTDNRDVLPGDRVTVYGEVDDDFFEGTEIEASSVYVENLNSYFYGDDVDADAVTWTVTEPIVVSTTTVRGTVTSVKPVLGEFTVDTGLREMTIDTVGMLYDPLDDEGYQQIDKGDRVVVTGEIDRGFFGDRELEADSIVTLSSQASKNADSMSR